MRNFGGSSWAEVGKGIGDRGGGKGWAVFGAEQSVGALSEANEGCVRSPLASRRALDARPRWQAHCEPFPFTAA
eukprot:scaffold32536_cov101-Isochrysis_galbana.AAC.1